MTIEKKLLQASVKSEGERIMAGSGCRNSRGFTLLEIIIAIFILVVGLLGVVTVTYMVIHGNSFSKTMTTATTLAKDKMEELKNMNYSSLPPDTCSTCTDTLQAIYTRTWAVSNSPATGMKTVVVTVTWNWKGAHSVILRTIVAE